MKNTYFYSYSCGLNLKQPKILGVLKTSFFDYDVILVTHAPFLKSDLEHSIVMTVCPNTAFPGFISKSL